MARFFTLLSLCLLHSVTFATSERYFFHHPKQLENALQQCPAKAPAKLSCEQLEKIAARMNEYAYQLRMNPQNYGQQILQLQTMLAKEEADLTRASEAVATNEKITHDRRQLMERLAVVKWLESPEG